MTNKTPRWIEIDGHRIYAYIKMVVHLQALASASPVLQDDYLPGYARGSAYGTLRAFARDGLAMKVPFDAPQVCLYTITPLGLRVLELLNQND